MVIELSVHCTSIKEAKLLVQKLRFEPGYLNACIREIDTLKDKTTEVKRYDC